MNIEEVGPLEVVRSELRESHSLASCPKPFTLRNVVVQVKKEKGYGYLSKMNLVEYDLIGMVDAPKPGDECYSRYEEKRELVIPFRSDCRFG